MINPLHTVRSSGPCIELRSRLAATRFFRYHLLADLSLFGNLTHADGDSRSHGFIGSYLCQYIAAKVGKPLRILNRNSARKSPAPGAEILEGGLSSSDCERFAGLDAIYYLAHTHSPIDSDLYAPTDAALNLMAFLNLLDAIRRLGSKPHIVYFSSGGAVHAPSLRRVPYRKSDPCSPASSYGIPKLTADRYLRVAAERAELTAAVLRVGNAFGTLLPEHRMQGLIGIALNNLLHGKPVRVFGNPDNVRDYVHLQDICAMVERASGPRRAFDIVNVGSRLGHSVGSVLSLIQDCHRAPFALQTEAAPGQWLPNWVVLDNSYAKSELGWSPAIGLCEGIAGILTSWNIDDWRAESAFAR
jgi:UDP-glucose 4-epimerase